MGVNVTFYLGKGTDRLTGRSLIIKNVSVDPPVTLSSTTPAAEDELATVELPENIMCEAVLVDTNRGGVASAPTRLGFSTNNNFLSLTKSGDLKIIAVEETSSSSSTSSVSSSSTSSLSSSSSSSTSTSTSTSSFSSLSSTSTSSLSSTSTSSASSASSSSTSSESSSSSSSS